VLVNEIGSCSAKKYEWTAEMMDALVAGENELERIQIQTQKQIQKFDNLENVKNSLVYILLMHFLVIVVVATVTLILRYLIYSIITVKYKYLYYNLWI
jgi:hypothetical protein